MTDIPFRAWRRRGGSAITGTIAGRPRAEIRLDASDSAGGRASASVPVALHGPGDVARLRPSSILATFPRPGQVDVETTYCPWIQFSAADLAWRYSPGPAQAGDVVPWLALLVVVDSEAAGEFAWQGSAARVSAKALARHPIDGGAAHVQGVPGADGETCRLLCRSELAEHTDYLALVVPVFDAAGRRRWGNGRAATLPVLHSWRFRTGPAGDFATLARALHSADDQEQFGRVHVDLGGGQTVDVRGALTGIDATTDPPPTDDQVQRLTALVSFDPDPGGEPGTDAAGRRYVRPPTYGAAWTVEPLETAHVGGWMDQVNTDPTQRVVAGVGLRAGIDLQDEITSAAATRFAATSAANQRLASVAMGLAAARSLWRRHVPADRDAVIALLGVSAGRVRAEGPDGAVRPLLALASGPERTLPAAFFSSAAQRVLRPGAARLHQAAPTAARLLSAANEPREVVSRPDHVGLFDGVAHGDAFVQFAREIGVGEINGVELTDGDSLPAVLANADADPATKAVLRHLESEGRRRPTPRPVDLDVLRDALVNAFDPHRDPVASVRVRATISPDDGTTAPREPCPDLDLPAWRYLRDHHREWLFPGAHTMTDGEVVGVASNPVFVDAFLLGLNTQALAELRWRNLPVASGCTPLRRFWDRHGNPGGAADERTDILGVHQWVGHVAGIDGRSQPLGHATHGPGGDRRQLVVVFCTDLFRRYPGTVVYLAPQTGAASWADADTSAGARVVPMFSAQITPRLVLYAFPVEPESLREVWVVVEQQPPGFRFARSDDRAGTAAERAAAMLVQPVRVLLAGTTLVGGQ